MLLREKISGIHAAKQRAQEERFMKKQTYVPAEPIVKGREDTFWYVIGERCISCGQCAANCPAGAIAEGTIGT